jgi:hypothetical protein
MMRGERAYFFSTLDCGSKCGLQPHTEPVLHTNYHPIEPSNLRAQTRTEMSRGQDLFKGNRGYIK